MHPHFAAALCCACTLACAADTGTDPSMVIDKYIQHFVVDQDGGYTLTVDNAKSIVQQRAIVAHSQYYISYNKNLDEITSVDAYTRKQDGRTVPVTADQVRDQQESASTDAPMFQDTRMKIVVFPDVAVGDQLVVRYVMRRHTPLFPGQFEDLSSSQFYVNKDFRLVYDMPASMPLFADAVGFETVPIDSAPGRKRYQWRYAGGDNTRIEADAVNYLDYGKRLAVSTFAGYPAFAQAYDARAHAPGSPAIKALARELTVGMASPRERALALSNWVRHNIRYVAVYVGAGGVVPHSPATVLENRYGDCKDHAVLLEALLADVDIDSSAALVNNGNAYRLPSVPTMGIFNHVVTYVPSLDLFLDPTSDSVVAGYLPASVLGKPALLTKTGQFKATPFNQVERNRTITRFGVEKTGSSSFVVTKITEGAIAESYRQAVRDTKPADRELFVQRMLAGLGQKGFGVFDAGKVDGGGDEYKMRFSGTSENFLNLPGPTGLATSFNFWGGIGDTVFSFAQEKERKQDFTCGAVDTEDETRFEFARGMRILGVPKSVSFADGHFHYGAQYTRRGNVVTVKRRVTFQHEGMVCTPADFLRMQQAIDRMIRDLKNQIIVTTA